MLEEHRLLARAIEALEDCANTCTQCADACLSEPDDQLPMMRRCIRTDLDCADLCATTGRILSRHTGYDANLTRAVLQACIQACKTCADECEQHDHAHCHACAAECRRCQHACETLLAGLG